MVYVSFVEILSKSKGAFEDNGSTEGMATLWSTLAFFGGVASMAAIDAAVHRLEAWNEAKGAERRYEERGGEGGDGTGNSPVPDVFDDVASGVKCNTRGSTIDKWVEKAKDEIKQERAGGDEEEVR